ncbi:hypothetical protein RB614_19705 [Phytohabitans sp. ZYX-F-186]|uniref:Uncharacterized protein n=1 Tax=Phytohabitans maris TaxID=3071409 RepID=A0ABU0ZIB7_9ACTN|nr:hypothetical protein [Phytohabitans sp. ZYX-F-186]MDQ7906745.1 hypothetical protein [Phytohabitans sp. ZYX-F-186]
MNITRTSDLVRRDLAQVRPDVAPAEPVEPAAVAALAPRRTIPGRAVVVRPPGLTPSQVDGLVKQCLEYIERHRHRLVGIADGEGALKLIASGGADLMVAVFAKHVPIPSYIRLVSDDWAETNPRTRRPRPERVSRLAPGPVPTTQRARRVS